MEFFTSCVEKYETHREETWSGTHGTTAQSWIMHVDYIHDFHNLECAIRTNDIDLFLHALTPIINLFLATNHINYSRWLSQFQLDLLNIDSTRSGLRDILSQGTFTVCRTSKSFNRSSVDLALEQTVNADEGSRLTGISAATNNYSTPLSWMVTKSSRAVVVSITQDMAGLFGSYDPIAEMRLSRIKRASSDIQKCWIRSRNPATLSAVLCLRSSIIAVEKLFPHQYRPVYWPYEIRES